MSIKTGLREGAELSRDSTGFHYREVLRLADLPDDPGRQLYEAFNRGAIPPDGSPHPVIPGTYLRRVVVGPHGLKSARVTLEWGPPESGGDSLGDTSIDVSSQTITDETITDINGVVMKTSFVSRVVTVGTDTFGGTDTRTETDDQIHRVQVERPTFALRITRVEPKSVFAKAVLYNQHVNVREWQGIPAKLWLMRVSSSQITTTLHRVTYDAVFNPSSWRAEIRTSQDGRVPNSVPSLRGPGGSPINAAANGIALRDVYPSADYDSLLLPRVD